MPRRQIIRVPSLPRPLPTRWLMTDERMGDGLWDALEALPRGGGVIFRHYRTAASERRALFARVDRIARRRGLVLILAGDAISGLRANGFHNRRGNGLRTASAHSIADLNAAQRRGANLVFISPVFATRSHPGAFFLGPMRAATIARAARVPVIALGGMNERRYRRLRALGYYGWAGIDAWTVTRRSGQKRNAVPR